jgi:hypothetical protein
MYANVWTTSVLSYHFLLLLSLLCTELFLCRRTVWVQKTVSLYWRRSHISYTVDRAIFFL